jgi:hypothetical protein
MKFLPNAIPLYSAMQNIGMLDKAREEDVAARNPDISGFEMGEGWESQDKYKAIRNMGTGNVVAMVSDGYATFQHRDMAAMTLSALNTTGYPCVVDVRNHRNVVKVIALFEDKIIKDDKTGCVLAARFSNSYNTQRSFTMELYAIRGYCMNEFNLRNMVPGGFVSVKHVGNNIEKVPGMIEEFAKKINDKYDGVQVLFDDARESPVYFPTMEHVKAVIAPILGANSHVEAVIPTIDLSTTRWDLYNAITAYASHAPGLSHLTQDRILVNASRDVLGVRELVVPQIQQMAIEVAEV